MNTDPKTSNDMETILLVEDDDTARGTLGKILNKEGFKVIIATNGQDGIDKFKAESPDIVITDLKMPQVDGMELLKRIKARSRVTDVIVITGHGDYDVAISALQAGATDYLKKPINLDELLVAVGRCKENIAKRKNITIKPTVLVIEDDETAGLSLFREVKKEGWNGLLAKDGEEGIRLMYEQRVDVVLTDLRIPKKDGLAVLEEVKASSGDCEVILMSGYGDEGVTIKAMRSGAFSYLKKPVDLDHALIAVERAFEKLQLNRAARYRARELELANQIIAKFSDHEVWVDFGGLGRFTGKGDEKPIPYLKKLADFLPTGLLFVDKNLKVIYANNCANEAIGSKPEAFDTKLIKQLSGNNSPNNSSNNSLEEEANKLISLCQNIFNKSEDIAISQVGNLSYLAVGPISIMKNTEAPQMISIFFRAPPIVVGKQKEGN